MASLVAVSPPTPWFHDPLQKETRTHPWQPGNATYKKHFLEQLVGF